MGKNKQKECDNYSQIFTCSAIKINIKQYVNIAIEISPLNYNSRNLHPFAVPQIRRHSKFLHSSLQPPRTHLLISEQPEDMALQDYQKGPAPTTYVIYLLMGLDKLEITFFFFLRNTFLIVY